jgi:rhodanese-related sulfurtransferase
MPTSVKDLLAEANQEVPKIAADEAKRLVEEEDGLLIDVRDGTEVAQTGRISGALNVSRGMIEFRADEAAPYHDPQFRKDRPIILYCASGGRSALAGKALKDMGYANVHNLGAFKEACEAGFPTEE